MHNGQNLLDIHESCRKKYTTAVFKRIFTKEEIQTGIIRERNSKSARQRLDKKRVKLFLSNIMMDVFS
jgi:hypothetical protein